MEYITKINKIFPEFEKHKGDLFYIITELYEHEHNLIIDLFVNSQIYYELTQIHYLQKLLEDDDRLLNRVDVIVNLRPENPFDAEFICSNPYINKDLIKNILDVYKMHFIKNNSYLSSGITYQIRTQEFTANQLFIFKDRFKRNPFKYKSERIRIEKMVIGRVYSYLKEKTKLIPKKNVQIPISTARIIYYLLSIFNISVNPQRKTNKVQSIIEFVKYEKKKLNPDFRFKIKSKKPKIN